MGHPNARHREFIERIALAEYKQKGRSKKPVDEAAFFAGWRAGCEFSSRVLFPSPPHHDERFRVTCDCGWSFESKSISVLSVKRGKHQARGAKHKTETTSWIVASTPPKET